MDPHRTVRLRGLHRRLVDLSVTGLLLPFLTAPPSEGSAASPGETGDWWRLAPSAALRAPFCLPDDMPASSRHQGKKVL